MARAFYLKGEDELARRHFEFVLAGNVPASVAANVQDFLNQIRARKRWSFSIGAAIAPDSNIGAGSDERIIDIFGFPFRRDQEELTTSGVGVSVWGGAEYQVPVAERLRLSAGGNFSRREYEGSQFDQLFLATHLGPRWLIDRDTDASVLLSGRQNWLGTVKDHHALGGRVEVGHRVSQAVTVQGRASWHGRRYRTRTGPERAGVGQLADRHLGDDADGAGECVCGVRARASQQKFSAEPQPLAGRGGLGQLASGLHRGRRRRVSAGEL